MPRKPVPVLTRSINLGIGSLTLEVTGNPLTFRPQDLLLLTEILAEFDKREAALSNAEPIGGGKA